MHRQAAREPVNVDGRFVGLALDQHLQHLLTDARIDAWLDQVLPLLLAVGEAPKAESAWTASRGCRSTWMSVNGHATRTAIEHSRRPGPAPTSTFTRLPRAAHRTR